MYTQLGQGFREILRMHSTAKQNNTLFTIYATQSPTKSSSFKLTTLSLSALFGSLGPRNSAWGEWRRRTAVDATSSAAATLRYPTNERGTETCTTCTLITQHRPKRHACTHANAHTLAHCGHRGADAQRGSRRVSWLSLSSSGFRAVCTDGLCSRVTNKHTHGAIRNQTHGKTERRRLYVSHRTELQSGSLSLVAVETLSDRCVASTSPTTSVCVCVCLIWGQRASLTSRVLLLLLCCCCCADMRRLVTGGSHHNTTFRMSHGFQQPPQAHDWLLHSLWAHSTGVILVIILSESQMCITINYFPQHSRTRTHTHAGAINASVHAHTF